MPAREKILGCSPFGSSALSFSFYHANGSDQDGKIALDFEKDSIDHATLLGLDIHLYHWNT